MTLAYMATDSLTNTIIIIDAQNDKLLSPTSGISVGTAPLGVAFTPDGSKAFVANTNGYTGTTGSISVIDTTYGAVVHTISISPYGWPTCVALGTVSGTTYAYVSVENADITLHDFVLAINTSTYAVSSPIYLGVQCFPHGIAITPNGDYAYVASNETTGTTNNGSVSIITTSNNNVSIPITFGTGYKVPTGVAITPDGNTVYVSISKGTPGAGEVAYWAANGSIPSTINYVTVGTGPQGIAITPGNSPQTVYVANTNDPSVSYFATGALPTVYTINTAVNSMPSGVAITPDGSKVYVGDEYHFSTIVISTASNTITNTISNSGGQSFGMFIQQNQNVNTPFVGGTSSSWCGC